MYACTIKHTNIWQGALANDLEGRYLNGHNELILSSERVVIKIGSVVLVDDRVINHVAVPTASVTLFSTVCGSACTHTLRLIMDPAGRVSVQTEPTTIQESIEFIKRYTSASCGDPQEIMKCLRNEVRMQCSLLKQKNLTASVTELPNASYGAFLALPCGREADWVGDRSLTFKYVFKNVTDLARVMGSSSITGWRLQSNKRGRKNASKEGFLLPFLQGEFLARSGPANCITYCLETRRLAVR